MSPVWIRQSPQKTSKSPLLKRKFVPLTKLAFGEEGRGCYAANDDNRFYQVSERQVHLLALL